MMFDALGVYMACHGMDAAAPGSVEHLRTGCVATFAISAAFCGALSWQQH
jgi:hypothetical protein